MTTNFNAVQEIDAAHPPRTRWAPWWAQALTWLGIAAGLVAGYFGIGLIATDMSSRTDELDGLGKAIGLMILAVGALPFLGALFFLIRKSKATFVAYATVVVVMLAVYLWNLLFG